MIRKAVEGIEIMGSLTLNDGVGGINPRAVEVSARLGAKVVWMPTLSSLKDRKSRGFDKGIFFLGEDGELLPEVREVLALVKEFDLVIGTGHISEEEMTKLFDEAHHMAIRKFVITHPLKIAGTSLDLHVQKEFADRGSFMSTVSWRRCLSMED